MCGPAFLLVLAFASLSFAQDQAQFKIGDKVEVRNMSSEWVRATVIGIQDWRKSGEGFVYRIHIDDPNAANPEWNAFGDRIRPIGELPPAQPPVFTPDPKPIANQPGAANAGGFKVGDSVDVFYDARRGKDRGTIVEIGNGKYKIHYDGCKSYWDAWEDRQLIHPAATISAADPEIVFLVGSWAMFTPSYPNTYVSGNTVYREYGVGAKAPPLQIKADGSYVWYFDFGKPAVRGKWRTHAKVGEKIGKEAISKTVTENGIIIKDPSGQEWKLYKWIMPGREDRITAQLMCSGETMVGSKIR